MESIDIDLFDNIQQGAAMRRKYVSEPKERLSKQASLLSSWRRRAAMHLFWESFLQRGDLY